MPQGALATQSSGLLLPSLAFFKSESESIEQDTLSSED
jgi:hypothetical protein